MDEFYTALLRIKFLCHVTAVCLIALTLIEGIRALSCLGELVQHWLSFAHHALA